VTSVVGGEIDGVLVVHLREFPDERGRFLETWRAEWFPDKPLMVQSSRSDSKAGVIRALHFHRKQADYWYCPRGRIFVALFDLRRSSPTSGKRWHLEIGEGAELGVYIPAGVAHGFQALTDATLTYLVDQPYDASDEYGVAWDDPDIGMPWPMPNPILSERDRTNPKVADLGELPL
jgi:dTDP-4-dehydrorhamnose 3,5-epimerase